VDWFISKCETEAVSFVIGEGLNRSWEIGKLLGRMLPRRSGTQLDLRCEERRGNGGLNGGRLAIFYQRVATDAGGPECSLFGKSQRKKKNGEM